MAVLRLRCVLAIYIVGTFLPPSSLLTDCGRSAVRHREPRNRTLGVLAGEGRIIQGKRSAKGAWPWQVSLQLLHPKYGLIGHWCGAVLIRPLWILTAAHCINNDLFNLPLAALWTAVLGEWDRDVEESTEIRVPIDRIIVHERFHNYQNDIAIMKLVKPVDTRTVCLPEEITSENLYPEIRKAVDTRPDKDLHLDVVNRIPRFLASDGHRNMTWLTDQINRISERYKTGVSVKKPSAECIATGWGRYTTRGAMTSTLLQATVPLHDNKLCQHKYGSSIPIRQGHLCAGRLDGTTGTCVGDSGGPLQCSMKDGRWILAGITSFGSGCAKPGYPDVYTRLTFYIPWINKQIDKYKD